MAIAAPSVAAPSTARPAAAGTARRRGPQNLAATRRRRASYRFGLRAEDHVAQTLQARGYVVLASRHRTASAEVDLIVARDDVVAFVEVKARRHGYEGLVAVDRRKRRQLTRGSQEWLADHPEFCGHSVRFDIALTWPAGETEFIENAFDAEPEDGFVF